jgi:1-acyl-sn-glycerol-3-phosphate acyltransferase
MRTSDVPCFEVGQTAGVRDYVVEAMALLCERLNLGNDQSHMLQGLALASLEAAMNVMQTSLNAGLVESHPVARKFWNELGDVLVNDDSAIQGVEHLISAIYTLRQGFNVLLVQNHRSGADILLMETLIRRRLGKDIASDWAYMAGHAVNLYAIPLMVSLATRRFQIFSAKYRSTGLVGNTDADMARQNTRSLMSLRKYCFNGGRIVVLYPEGGRGDDSMKMGEPRTVCIPQIMRRGSKRKLYILPTYVNGTANILPTVRSKNEFNEIFVNAQRGTASLSLGQLVNWDHIQPDDSQVAQLAQTYQQQDRLEGNVANERAYSRIMVDTMLGLVAQLAPNDHERGPYADPKHRALK